MCIDGMAGYDEMHTEKCRKKCWQELEKNKHSAPRFHECQHGKKEGKDTLPGILRYFFRMVIGKIVGFDCRNLLETNTGYKLEPDDRFLLCFR